MRKLLLIMIILVFCTSGALGSNPLTCQQLISEAKIWDGKMVSISGEVVGDVLHSGGNAWLNINDGTNALGVWAQSGVIEEFVIVPGRYETIGTRFRIEGQFNRTCSEHSGETDIHLSGLWLLEGSENVSHAVKGDRLIIAASLIVLSVFLQLVGAKSRKRPQEG